jgi:hypothetical protein
MLEHLNYKLSKQIKNSLHIDFIDANTYIVVLAISNQLEFNKIQKISCKAGVPIKGYVYDAQNDNYCVECADYLNLGMIPVQIALSYSSDEWKLHEWKIVIPAPEKIIEKKLSITQKKQLKEFKKKYATTEFTISYMQFKI